MDVLLRTTVLLVITALAVSDLCIVSVAVLQDIVFKSCLRFAYICISFLFMIYIFLHYRILITANYKLSLWQLIIALLRNR
jgi:bacteriorhodopsin